MQTLEQSTKHACFTGLHLAPSHKTHGRGPKVREAVGVCYTLACGRVWEYPSCSVRTLRPTTTTFSAGRSSSQYVEGHVRHLPQHHGSTTNKSMGVCRESFNKRTNTQKNFSYLNRSPPTAEAEREHVEQ